VGLVGLGTHAAFEFHVSSWLGGGDDLRFPTGPEVRRLKGIPVVCIEGTEESDSGCKGLSGAAKVETVPGGHHYGGDYAGLVARVLQEVEEGKK
jgi:type IV secretory pathway VirJ component